MHNNTKRRLEDCCIRAFIVLLHILIYFFCILYGRNSRSSPWAHFDRFYDNDEKVFQLGNGTNCSESFSSQLRCVLTLFEYSSRVKIAGEFSLQTETQFNFAIKFSFPGRKFNTQPAKIFSFFRSLIQIKIHFLHSQNYKIISLY